LRSALAGLPFAEDAIGIIEAARTRRAKRWVRLLAKVIKDLLALYGLLLVDPMDRAAVRKIAAPLMRRAVEPDFR